MTHDTQATLAEIALSEPAASRVLHQRGLDYCCGGQRSLDDACQAADLDPQAILEEIRQQSSPTQTPPWTDRPLEELVGFIVDRYHATLRRELPELVALAEKVETRHADKRTCPRGLAAHLRGVHEGVLDHLAKEEQVLFPMILAGHGAHAWGPVHVMEQEHRDHAANLQRIRDLTANLVPPPEACTSWKALYLRLDELEAELMEHIHLENNVLFPRALREEEVR
jgi:regulator of cell morphogenesis and NO signaling